MLKISNNTNTINIAAMSNEDDEHHNGTSTTTTSIQASASAWQYEDSTSGMQFQQPLMPSYSNASILFGASTNDENLFQFGQGFYSSAMSMRFPTVMTSSVANSSGMFSSTLPFTRTRTLTSRGREYQMETLLRRRTRVSRKVRQQINILANMQLGIDKETIKSEVKRLDELLDELDGVTAQLIDITEEPSEHDNFRVTLEEIEALAVRAKQDAYQLISDSRSGRGSESQLGSCAGSSKSGFKVEEWLIRSDPAPTIPSSGQRRTSAPCHIFGGVSTVQSIGNLNLEGQDDVLAQYQSPGLRSAIHASSIPSDQMSNCSISSKSALFTKKAAIDGRKKQVKLVSPCSSDQTTDYYLKSAAEMENAKEMERQHYNKLVHLAAEAKRKEDEIEERLKDLHREIAEAETIKKLNQGTKSPQVSSALGSLECGTASATHPIALNSAVPSDLGRALTQLVNLQAAPKPALDTFAGDPLKYIYFRTAFKDVVESCVPDERGRLNRLLTHTAGAAKELVQTCVYLGDHDCFTKAMELLDSEYGGKLKVARAFIKQLKEMEYVKGADAESWKKLYRLLLNCKTYKSTGNLNELDRPDIISIVVTKLDTQFQDRWASVVEKIERTQSREVTFDDLLKFVKIQSACVSHPSFSRQALKNFKANATKTVLVCNVCNEQGSHATSNCPVLESLSIDDRYRRVFHQKLCFGCLSPMETDHNGKTCRQKLTCNECWADHPTILHKSSELVTASQNSGVVEDASDNKGAVSNINKDQSVGDESEIQTSMCVVLVRVAHKDNPAKEMLSYALLDQDCTGCFILPSLLSELAPQNSLSSASISVDTMNGLAKRKTMSTKGLVVKCSNKHAERHGSVEVDLPVAYASENMPFSKEDMPSSSALKQWAYLEEVSKLVPEYDSNVPFGLVIGNKCKQALEPLQLISSIGDGPFAYRTHLGWCVVGPVQSSSSSSKSVKVFFTQVRLLAQDMTDGKQSSHYFLPTTKVRDTTISDKLNAMYVTEFSERFREDKTYSVEDGEFMRIMKEGVRKVEGHFEAPAPFRKADIDPPDNKGQALKRLFSLKPKMQRNPAFKEEYSANMEKLISLRAQKSNSSLSSQQKRWFIPHHAVQAKGKSMRVVFDCSAEYEGFCLNDELLQGPDLINLLVGVLIRFRKEAVALSADLEACYHQINIPPAQRRFFSFLWWLNGDVTKTVHEYEMCVHLFGAVSSPSIANYIINRIGADSAAEYGDDVRKVLQREFYVDNLLTSVPTETEAISLLSRTAAACAEGGFNLRKVASNSPSVIKAVPKDKRAGSLQHYDIGKMLPIEKALGVIWNIELDELGFRIAVQDTPLTRRNILATISSIHDPPGLIAPFLLKGRKILQEISSDGYSWDCDPQQHHRAEWTNWRNDLLGLKDLSISRCYKPPDFGKVTSISLHHFCDANDYGYGMSTYLRQVSDTGVVAVSLVMGKSRVTPLKAVTIPRLELNACTLAAEVGSMVKSELDIPNIFQAYWTDSKICLGYISNETKRVRIYVANRREKIRYYTNVEQWQHIDGQDNPADHASRGISFTKDKEKVQHWFGGARFLHANEEPWRSLTPPTVYEIPDNDAEIKKVVKVSAAKVSGDARNILSWLESRVSKWNVMIRVLAWVYMFLDIYIYKCVSKVDPKVLAVRDTKLAEVTLLRMIQADSFADEILFYKQSHGTLPKRVRKGKGNIWRLDPFVDEEGLLRVGGRIRYSAHTRAEKHPVILPKNSIAVKRIIEYFHASVQHGGRPATTNAIRSHGFWVVSGNAQVKRLIYNCVPCRKYRGRLGEQKMADLPEERTMETAPFTNSGVDLFGPFKVKERKKTITVFVALFTCFSSRAIHLEAVGNLSADSFILALRRFLARRGPTISLRSDNGTNFIGADNEFRRTYNEMDHSKIGDFLLEQKCDWIRWEKNTPEASHTGGIWERQIRSVRSVLTSLLHEHASLLSYEAFQTLLAEAELIVNSRPLTTDTSEPNHVALSPIQLLTLKSKVVLPPPGVFQKEDLYCKRRWRQVQHLANLFWSRFRKEYLQNLQLRNKWNHPKRNFMVNDIVLLRDSAVGRQQWPMAKVTKTFPGSDGLVRSVELKVPSATKTLKRPIQKIVLLVEASE